MGTDNSTIGAVTVTVSHELLRVPPGLEEKITAVAEQEGFRIIDLSVVLTDHETVSGLNEAHLDRTYDTDVLAFDLGGRGDRRAGSSESDRTIDGEIYVDLDTASERSPEFGVTYEEEVHRYVIHGLLHLMGYVDDTDEGRAEMRRLENLYLG